MFILLDSHQLFLIWTRMQNKFFRTNFNLNFGEQIKKEIVLV